MMKAMQMEFILQFETISVVFNVGANSFSVALLASIAMTTVARGNTYRKLEQVLMDAHSLLLQKLLETSKESVTLIGARCERLSAIIRHSTIPPNAQLLQLQLKVMIILVIYLFTYLFVHIYTRSLAYLPLVHSCHSLVYLVIRLFGYLFVCSFTCYMSCLHAHLILHSEHFYSTMLRYKAC